MKMLTFAQKYSDKTLWEQFNILSAKKVDFIFNYAAFFYSKTFRR